MFPYFMTRCLYLSIVSSIMHLFDRFFYQDLLLWKILYWCILFFTLLLSTWTSSKLRFVRCIGVADWVSGFVGKAVLAKHLGGAAGLPSEVFVLLREQKGKSAAARLKDIMINPIFDPLRMDRVMISSS